MFGTGNDQFGLGIDHSENKMRQKEVLLNIIAAFKVLSKYLLKAHRLSAWTGIPGMRIPKGDGSHDPLVLTNLSANRIREFQPL